MSDFSQIKELVEIYDRYNTIEELELSLGRILLVRQSEAVKADKKEEDEAKKAVKDFFEENLDKFKKAICEKFKEGKKGMSYVELVALVAEVLTGFMQSIELSIFVAFMIVSKYGVEKLCN